MAFLLFGTFWFWFILAVAFIVVTALIEGDDDETHGIASGFVLAVTLTLFGIFGNWEAYKTALVFIRDNPLNILMCIGAYVVLGIGWSFWKWYIFLKNVRNKLKKDNPDMKLSGSEYRKLPQFDNQVSRITSWMMYWPFSALWTLTHKFFRDIFTWISERLKGAYERIANNMFKDFENEEKSNNK